MRSMMTVVNPFLYLLLKKLIILEVGYKYNTYNVTRDLVCEYIEHHREIYNDVTAASFAGTIKFKVWSKTGFKYRTDVLDKMCLLIHSFGLYSNWQSFEKRFDLHPYAFEGKKHRLLLIINDKTELNKEDYDFFSSLADIVSLFLHSGVSNSEYQNYDDFINHRYHSGFAGKIKFENDFKAKKDYRQYLLLNAFTNFHIPNEDLKKQIESIIEKERTNPTRTPTKSEMIEIVKTRTIKYLVVNHLAQLLEMVHV